MGRPSTARDRLLEAACDLMGSRGYGSIGVAEICATADVRKGSFYHFFESKQALVLAAIDAHWAAQRPGWVTTLASPGGPASLEKLLADQVAYQRYTLAATGSIRGCLLANLALELSSADEVIKARLAAIFDEQISLVAAELGGDKPLARAVLAQLEGMVLFARLANSVSPLDDLWPQTQRLLGPARAS
ncbi:TetR/AcrR family transcriptional regulator [Longispora albida]|uniref:TetR/AcrR family transcriptional regulator n=1 Tax=Longispora albida TaxID=203523 RepID=UPI00035E552A|nr:TetR/AcrR family transcriptional regulator [Longispora albida]